MQRCYHAVTNQFTAESSYCDYLVKYGQINGRRVTFDVKSTRRHIITEAALVLSIVIQLCVMDHQPMNRPITNYFVLLSVWFDLLSVLLPRQLNVILGHGARQGDVLTDQRLGVLQTFDELERQRWTTATYQSM